MEQILSFGLQGVVAYGAVGLLSLLAEKKGVVLSSEVKLYSLVGIAFLVGFIPADLGNFVFQHLKEAIGVGLSLSALNTLATKAGGS